MLFERLENISKDKIALKYEGHSICYGELLELVKNRAAAFIEVKNNIFLNKPNEKENLIDFLACMYSGTPAIFGAKSLPELVLADYLSKFNCQLSSDFVSLNNKEAKIFTPTSDTVFLGVLSSGTSGVSKVIWKDYQAWFSAFPHQSAVFGITANDTVFVLDALSYSANLNAVLHAIWQGCTVILTKLNEAKSWPVQIEKEQVSSIFMVPSHLCLFDDQITKFHNVKSIVTAGEKLKNNLAKKIQANFPNALLTEYYGAAELGHVSYIQGEDVFAHPHSVGKAFPEVKIELKGNRIFVKSPFVSPDYRKTPSVSDIGEIDADGFLYLLGREGRMFNKRGLNIFAQEIENTAEQHPLVNAAYLMPKPEKDYSFELWVEVSKPLKSADLRSFLALHLIKEKLPNSIFCLTKLPRNIAGKVNFKALQKIPSEESIIIE
jgi:long-chain acyl-CoA synthetase